MTTHDLRASLAMQGREIIDAYRAQWQKLGEEMFAGEVNCVDPTVGDVLWLVPNLSVGAVDRAIRGARRAQPEWEQAAASQRAKTLNACADAIEANATRIANLLALETGKSLSKECHGEVALCASVFRYFAGLVHEIKGKSIQASPTLLGFTTRHPWGVVAGIVPWNVPLMFMAYKIATPLAAGNAVVVKIPEQASATLLLCRKILSPHLPEGLVQFMTGSGSGVGAAIIGHTGVDKISFTGSVETGREIYKSAANKLQSATLELGGKSPMVILEDCDLDKAVEGAFGSMRFTRAGQSCTAASRIYVHRGRINAFKTAMAARLDAMVIGDPLDERTDCGPIVTCTQMERINGYLSKAKDDGLDVQAYGRVAWGEHQGWFVRPHLIFNPSISHAVSQEEIFGPIATVTAYDSISEVIELANATPYGLSASVWGKDINACMQLARGFRCGIVQINQNAVMLPGFSYGGLGISGIGKEGSLDAMLETYTYEKTNIVNFG